MSGVYSFVDPRLIHTHKNCLLSPSPLLLPCRSWRNDCNAHVQDPHAQWCNNVGDGVVLLYPFTAMHLLLVTIIL